MCEHTPRQEVVLPLDATAPAAARAWLRVVNCSTHSGALMDDATLLVSELVTNAVRYGGPPIVLAVDCDGVALDVRVRDGAADLPVPRPVTSDAEDGRGYVLLDMISDRWGVEPELQGMQGKEVWFHLRAHD
ncbi:MAG TPA: ATP-binding protein [Mycobacteriales bacterium]|jgi:anti-sigma regulatory factor (Ser/Thr protein kinase)|nr:ATP-binding protein [Mycobacteriales bacterium]